MIVISSEEDDLQEVSREESFDFRKFKTMLKSPDAKTRELNRQAELEWKQMLERHRKADKAFYGKQEEIERFFKERQVYE